MFLVYDSPAMLCQVSDAWELRPSNSIYVFSFNLDTNSQTERRTLLTSIATLMTASFLNNSDCNL